MESFKRRVPVVDPVELDGVRYEVTRGALNKGFAQNSGVLSAVEVASGKELWTVAVYPVVYSEGEEEDAQDVFITALVIGKDGKTLDVTNERGQRFVVNLADHAVAAK